MLKPSNHGEIHMFCAAKSIHFLLLKTTDFVDHRGLSDFVDRDVAIGEDVACSLRQRGRVADAALLLSKLPNERSGEDVDAW
jgi:hypothetical protein